MDFLITGTQVYGPTSPDSDLDIVVKHKDAFRIYKFLTDHDIKWYRTESQDDYGDTGGFYFDFVDMKINIIIAIDDSEFNRWRERTDKMKKLPEIPDRDLRVDVFNSSLPMDTLRRTVEGLLKGTLTKV